MCYSDSFFLGQVIRKILLIVGGETWIQYLYLLLYYIKLDKSLSYSNEEEAILN